MTIFLHRNLRSFNDRCSRISRSRISPCHSSKMVFFREGRGVSAPPGEPPRCRCQNQEKWGQKSRHEKMMSMQQQQQQKGMFVALYRDSSFPSSSIRCRSYFKELQITFCRLNQLSDCYCLGLNYFGYQVLGSIKLIACLPFIW